MGDALTRRELATVRRLQNRWLALGRAQRKAFRDYAKACARTPEARVYTNLLRATARAANRITEYPIKCRERRQEAHGG